MTIVIYRGSTNNSIHSFYGPDTLAKLQEQAKIAARLGWEEAHRRIPNAGSIATFTTTLHPVEVGYVTGTFEEFDRWCLQFEVSVVQSYLGNGVPFSNGRYAEESGSSLTEDQFHNMFGHDRPWDSLSHPRWRRV